MAEGYVVITPVGTCDYESEVLHALPGTQIFQQIGNERRLIAEGNTNHWY
jgi:hypothetical protein